MDRGRWPAALVAAVVMVAGRVAGLGELQAPGGGGRRTGGRATYYRVSSKKQQKRRAPI